MTALAHYDAARRAIAEARTVDDVKDILDRNEAKRAYAHQIKDKTMENDAKEIRWRATRRLGEMIGADKAADRLNKGARGQLKGRDASGGAQIEPPEDGAPTLADAGIDKKLSALAQKYAGMDETSFDRLVQRCREFSEQEDESAPLDVLRHELKEKKRAAEAEAFAERTAVGCNVTDLAMLAESGQRFRTIYADPPWEFRVYSGAGKDRSADRHYKTGGLDSIKALPVEALAHKDCALFMWCVMPELQGALDVIKAWGFEFKTVAFTWVKQNKSGEGLFWGMGYWTRANAELCLLATRGHPERLDKGVHQVLLSPIQEHSRKPDEIRKRIERLIGGPRLELYARRECEGWTTWGNEIPRASFPVDASGAPLTHNDDGEITEHEASSPAASPEPAAHVAVPPKAETKAAGSSFNRENAPTAKQPAAVLEPADASDQYEIPSFCRRNPDNSFQSRVVSVSPSAFAKAMADESEQRGGGG